MTATANRSQDETLAAIRADFDRLRGRLFQLFEATGMPDRQCDAAKGLVRRITYDGQAQLERDLRAGGDE
jgi:hypothetical protein